VVKRSGEIEPYDRRKLLTSIQVAAAKRPIAGDGVDALVEEVERLLDRSDSTEVESQQIGGLVMERLKVLDHIAYVRFASVYRNFQDLTEFYEEIRDLDQRSVFAELRRYQRELPLGAGDEAVPPAERPADEG
jgi:transcriptional repressor NrdR